MRRLVSGGIWGLAVGCTFGVLLLAARIITNIEPGIILSPTNAQPRGSAAIVVVDGAQNEAAATGEQSSESASSSAPTFVGPASPVTLQPSDAGTATLVAVPQAPPTDRSATGDQSPNGVAGKGEHGTGKDGHEGGHHGFTRAVRSESKGHGDKTKGRGPDERGPKGDHESHGHGPKPGHGGKSHGHEGHGHESHGHHGRGAPSWHHASGSHHSSSSHASSHASHHSAPVPPSPSSSHSSGHAAPSHHAAPRHGHGARKHGRH